jgi:hypothetical protein
MDLWLKALGVGQKVKPYMDENTWMNKTKWMKQVDDKNNHPK